MNIGGMVGSVASDLLPGLAGPAADAPGTTSAFAALLSGILAPAAASAAAAPTAAGTSELEEPSEDAAADEASATELAAGDVSMPASVVLGRAAAGLDQALQEKLARVVSRMKSEYGRDVQVVEGLRSQARQNSLYAQGRAAAGPVVTWTRSSLHTAGRAADLTVNGGYTDAAGFSLLRQVAEEEGLHTLGAKDPGHVELPGGLRGLRGLANAAVRPSAELSLAGMAPAQLPQSPAGAVAAVARVANVATVAAPASVARVATTSRGGAARVDAPLDRAAAPATGAPIQPAGQPSGSEGGFESRSGEQESEGTPRRALGSALASEMSLDSRAGEAAYRVLDGARIDGSATDARGLHTDAAARSAERTIRAMDAQDAAGPRTLSHLTLALDDGHGGQDRVRVDMRGQSIGASFDMRDAAAAERISSRLSDLTRALERQGLEPQAFQVRTAASARSQSHSGAESDAAGRNSQQDDHRQQSQRQQDERRRRGTAFSLTSDLS